MRSVEQRQVVETRRQPTGMTDHLGPAGTPGTAQAPSGRPDVRADVRTGRRTALRTSGPNRETGFASHTEHLGFQTARRHRAGRLPSCGGGNPPSDHARSACRRSVRRRSRGLGGSPCPAREPRPRVDHRASGHRSRAPARQNPPRTAPARSPAIAACTAPSSTPASGLRLDPTSGVGMPAPAQRSTTGTWHSMGAREISRLSRASGSSS